MDNKHFANIDDIKCDDLGAWTHNGTPLQNVNVEKTEDGGLRIDLVDGSDNNDDVESNGTIFTLKRSYFTNVSSPDLKKTIATLYNKNASIPITLVQYVFKGEEHEIVDVLPHGNSKRKTAYVRLKPTTIETLRNTISSSKTPKRLLDETYLSAGAITQVASASEIPRGPADLYNARHSARQTDANTNNNNDNHRLLWTILERAKTDENKFIQDCTIHPSFSCTLYTEKQIKQMVVMLTCPSRFTVFGLDPTFNIFLQDLSLTVTSYRNLKLVNQKTMKHPVFIGPLYIHEKKDTSSYSRFAYNLINEAEDLASIFAIGTDGEVSLVNGLKRNFKFAAFLRCFIHFRGNIKQELRDRRLVVAPFISDIFGQQIGDTKYLGLVDVDSHDDFDCKFDALENSWNDRETVLQKGLSFHEWFRKFKAAVVKDSMLKTVRVDAGLGNPPKEYTTNDCEASNFMVKHGLNFEKSDPVKFINEVREIIDGQFRNEERAVMGSGPWRVADGLPCTDAQKLSQLSLTDKENLLKDYESVKMDDSITMVTTSTISIKPGETGIMSVPLPVLQQWFLKAETLIKEKCIFAVPPSNGTEFIVCTGTKKYTVKSAGKRRGAFSCDKVCANKSTKLCEHVIAVAASRNELNELIIWFKNLKTKGACLSAMAVSGGAKGMGQKKNTRKRSNTMRAPPTTYIDMLLNDDTSNTANQTPTPYTNIFGNFSNVISPTFQPPTPQFTQLHPGPSTSFVSSANGQLPPQQPNSFCLKWLYGTTVSKCYGCSQIIQNPPASVDESLIVVYRDKRWYFDQNRQPQVTANPENVHFHLRLSCIRNRYPAFIATSLVVPPEFYQHLNAKHKSDLHSQFGISM